MGKTTSLPSTPGRWGLRGRKVDPWLGPNRAASRIIATLKLCCTRLVDRSLVALRLTFLKECIGQRVPMQAFDYPAPAQLPIGLQVISYKAYVIVLHIPLLEKTR
jgi:hypothetical protein